MAESKKTPSGDGCGVDPEQKDVSGPRAVHVGATPTSYDLETVFREHHVLVWRGLRRLGVREHEIDDAVQDVFLVVARRLHEFEGRSSLRTWIFSICLRVSQSKRRDAARIARNRDAVARVRETVLPHDHAHARADAARTLHQLLDRLHEDQRAVFVMSELEEMTAPEIAEILSVKVPTVYSRLRLAREKLERWVEQQRLREQEPAHALVARAQKVGS